MRTTDGFTAPEQASAPSTPGAPSAKRRCAPRPSRAIGAVASLGSLVGAVWWLNGSPMAAARVAFSQNVDFERLFTAAAALTMWTCIAWFAAVVVMESATVVPGAVGRFSGRLAARVGPAFVRRAARWLVGVTLLAGPLVSGAAMAAQNSNASAGPASSYPNLDRPVATATQSARAQSVAPTATTANSTGPVVDLDRPVTPYLPPAPYLPPPPPVATRAASGTTSGSASHLLTGSPHREVPADGYVVRSGDALWDIAARHLGPDATAADIAREWPRWYAANRAVIGANPSLIRPGAVLHAPQS